MRTVLNSIPHTPYPVIDLSPDQKDIEKIGGTMRLGVYPCKTLENTLIRKAYGQEIVFRETPSQI
jgi:CTP synthase